MLTLILCRSSGYEWHTTDPLSSNQLCKESSQWFVAPLFPLYLHRGHLEHWVGQWTNTRRNSEGRTAQGGCPAPALRHYRYMVLHGLNNNPIRLPVKTVTFSQLILLSMLGCRAQATDMSITTHLSQNMCHKSYGQLVYVYPRLIFEDNDLFCMVCALPLYI